MNNQSVFNYGPVECVAPFSSLFINNNGKGFPCCVFNYNRTYEIDSKESIIWNFTKTNQKIREEFKELGRDFDSYKDCSGCNGLDRKNFNQRTSQNMRAEIGNDYLTNPKLTSLHLKFSNQCNFACRMCDPYSSNLLSNDPYYNYPINIVNFITEESVIYKSIIEHLPNLNHLWFSGGETLLHKEVWTILKHLSAINKTDDIEIQLNTNGSIKLTDNELELLKNFKNLNLQISIDGIEALAEYIRTNLVWKNWIRNFEAYREKLGHLPGFSVSVTISVFNIHKIKELDAFFYDNYKVPVHYNFVFGPIKSTVAYNISDLAKEFLVDLYKDFSRKNEIINFLNNKRTLSPEKLIQEIDERDNQVLQGKIYKNFKPYRLVEPEWYRILCQ